MADLSPRTGDDADLALLERARAGDSDAFGELYTREVDAARRLARILVGEQGAEELVSESFARVLTQLQAGRGPTDDFRAYLHVTIRNGFRDGLRATKESPSSDQPWLLDDVLPPVEELVEDLDREVAVTALATLPKSWQQVLWHLEVEGRKPAEVATILDMDAGAVSSLAYRAREGLKRAYLDQHLQPATGGQCGWTQSRMSQYVRGDLSPRAQQKVADHLDECEACSAAFLSVDRVNKKLAAWLFPVVLWGVASAHKGGLLWIAGAGAAGRCRQVRRPTGTATSGPSGSAGGAAASNPVVLGAAAAAVACAVAGSVVLALTVGNDKSADRLQRGPAGRQPHRAALRAEQQAAVRQQDRQVDDRRGRTRRRRRERTSATTPVIRAHRRADRAGGSHHRVPPTPPPPPTTEPPTTPRRRATADPGAGRSPPDRSRGASQRAPRRRPLEDGRQPRGGGLRADHAPGRVPLPRAGRAARPVGRRLALRRHHQRAEPVRRPGGLHLRLLRWSRPGDRPERPRVVPDPRSGPAASVRLYADGKLVDSGTF